MIKDKLHGKELNFEAILELKREVLLVPMSMFSQKINALFVFSIIYSVNNSHYKILKIVEIGIGFILRNFVIEGVARKPPSS